MNREQRKLQSVIAGSAGRSPEPMPTSARERNYLNQRGAVTLTPKQARRVRKQNARHGILEQRVEQATTKVAQWKKGDSGSVSALVDAVRAATPSQDELTPDEAGRICSLPGSHSYMLHPDATPATLSTLRSRVRSVATRRGVRITTRTEQRTDSIRYLVITVGP